MSYLSSTLLLKEVQYRRRGYAMRVTLLILTILMTDVAAILLKYSHVEDGSSRAIGAVLETTSEPSCSLILLTDGITASSTIFKAVSSERASPWGVTVFDIVTDALDRNETLTELSTLVGQARMVRLGSRSVSVVVVSHDPAFLTAFAESSLKGRLLVWATRLLVVTSLTLPQLFALLPSHWTFSMMNVIFLNLEKPPNVRYSLFTYLPYNTNGAQVARVAFWSPSQGITLLAGLSLFPEKFLDFHGATINITVLPWPPYWDEEVETTPNGTYVTKYSGSDYLVLKTMIEDLNFTFDIIPTSSWDEVIDKVVVRESFMVPNYYIIFPERLKRYDITHIYEFSQATFSMAKPSLKPSWQSLYYPLANQVWIAVLALLLLMPAIFYMVKTKGKKDVDGRFSVGEVALEVMGILVGQSLPLRLPNASSSRLLVASWLVFAFIIGTAYRGNLIAALTLPKYPPRPETVEQMVDTVDKVTMPPFGKDWLSFFEASESEVYKRLAKLMVLGPGANEGLRMATEENTAQMHARRFMANMIAEHFTRVDGSTPLYLAQESIFPAPSGWPIPHDAPYRPQMDRILMCIIEAGLYEKWSEDLLRETRRKSKQRQRENLSLQQQQKVKEETESGSSIKALTLTHMQGPIMILLLGLVLSAMSFAGNIIAIRCGASDGSHVHSVK